MIPWVFTDSAQGVSRLAPIATEIDLGSRQITFTTPVTHFSQVEGRGGFFSVTLSPLTDHVWGDPFQMTATITQASQSQVTVTRNGVKVNVLPVGDVTLYGIWGYNYLFSPSLLQPAPPNTALKDKSFTVVQSFKCADVGLGAVKYIGELWYAFGTPNGDSLIQPKNWDNIAVVSEPHRCTPPVSPISASFDQSKFTTTYTLAASENLALDKASWSGPNCGSSGTLPSRPTGDGKQVLTFQWTHPHPPCDPTTDHQDVLIWIYIPATNDIHASYWLCEYKGAATGTGSACRLQP